MRLGNKNTSRSDTADSWAAAAYARRAGRVAGRSSMGRGSSSEGKSRMGEYVWKEFVD